TGPYGVHARNGSLAVRSREGTAGVVVGQFDGDPFTDLIVANSGSDRFSLLRGTGGGGFLNPESPRAFATDGRPTVARAGDFNGDNNLDLAILDEGSSTTAIFTGDG